MSKTPRRYVIVGAGVFGSSTALSLKKSEPDADVILLDRTPFPCPMGAGHDLNKIVRADYTDLVYMRLAIRALNIWNTHFLYSQHFHNTGAIYHLTDDFSRAVLSNWERTVGKDETPSRLIDTIEAKGMFNGLFSDADREMVTSVLWSPTAGWVDSAAALESVIQAAVDLGVTYVQSAVSKVLFDNNIKCIGVETLDGETIRADQTILAAGAYIPWILAESAPEMPEIHTHDRLIAVGAPMAAFKVTDEVIQGYKDWPVCELIAKLQAECIAPDATRKLVKLTYDSGLTNRILHERSKREISVPPFRRSQQVWSQDVPEIIKHELAIVRKEVYGEKVQMEPEYYRLCWDGFTKNQDFLITPHPKSKGLFIAGGGSFHGFKFLPIIGDLIVDMLRGKLDPELAKRWAWDALRKGGICDEFEPKRDLQELL